MASCPSNAAVWPHSYTENENEEVLVANAKLGDERAMTELWRRHGKVAHGVLWRITGNHEDAEDALQETFLKSFVHLQSFDGRSKFSTWLVRIATNTALMLLRKRRNRPEILLSHYAEGFSDGTGILPDDSEDVESQVIRSQQTEMLRDAVKALHPSFRRVIELRHKHDYSVEQIAKVTGLSVPAAKSRLYRARIALRESGQLKGAFTGKFEAA